MQRFPLPKICFCRAVLLTVGLGSSLFISSARADEFAVVPKGDPIYAQLSSLARPGSEQIAPTLTRYEAALQTARIILNLPGRDDAAFSRSNWRALKTLSTSLRVELGQLGIDVDATIALADSNLQSAPKPDLSLPASKRPKVAVGNSSATAPASSVPADFSLRASSLDNPRVVTSGLEVPLSQRARASAALTSVERSSGDPFRNDFGTRSANGLAEKSNLKQLGSQASVAYDLNPKMTLRASNSKISSDAGDLPLLSAPFLKGANDVSSTGGGLDFNVGSGLKLSTELARLRADNGASAARFGGGASLSAFQNRLSMNMSLSRLLPEDDAALPSTAAQLGVGLDVTRRLSLSLLYQGLFTESANNNASRFSGGFSLHF